ncbi:MAG: CHC2 zinc finger domain-containing protein, partial [Candidatus Omnitrophica bacterium]|nr:CHC2 zinc finger domain-containing protein [Candidatus Omnitrophota bacterium]
MFKYQKLIEGWVGRSLRPNSRGEVKINCPHPNHKDKTPSFCINFESGLWHCFGCELSGNIYQLADLLGKSVDGIEDNRADIDESWAQGQHPVAEMSEDQRLRRESLLEEVAKYYHKQLMNATDDNLADKYLVSKKIARSFVAKYQIGLAYKDGLYEYLNSKGFHFKEQDDCGLVRKFGNKIIDVFRDAVVFPVFKNNKVVYLVARQLAEGAKPKYLNIKGAIKWLYNEDSLENTHKAIIAEGIPDALTLIHHGYPAVGTLGAGNFKPEFAQKFAGVKNKFVSLDSDLAGFNGMKKIDQIFQHDIKVIALPEGVKDVNDYFNNHTKEDFDALIKKAKWFDNYALDRATAKDIYLVDIESSENIHKRVKVIFRVAGVGAVYFVPIRFRAHYKEDGDLIHAREFVIPQNNIILLKMCKESKDAQLGDCRKFAKSYLGQSVKIERIEILDYISMTQILALPKVKELKVGASGAIVTEEGKEYCQKVAYFQGVKNTTSKLYNATGYVVADPLTSEARFLVSDYEEIREEFDKFRLTPEIIKQFETLGRKSSESIDEYLDKLAESAAYHFIRIYGEARKDAIIANLLCFHSPLYFYYEDEIVNGWLQIACIGDTTTGKSQIANRIRKFVDVGVYVTGETCSRTGFLYAIDTKTLSSCILTWGLLPQQDRSLLIIDGANYISREDWGTAREARRSGKLIVERIVKGEHPCRARLILAANPSKPLSQYIYPIEATKDIFGDPDIARLDLCICFSGSDVPKEEINM